MDNSLNKVTYAAFFVLFLGVMTSVSLGAVSHVLFAIPGFYFLYKDFAKKERSIEFTLSAKFLLAVIVTIILSVLFNLDGIERPMKSISKIKYFLIPLISLFAVDRLMKDFMDTKKAKVLLYIFLLASTVASISGLIGLYTGFNPLKMKDACHSSRACGLFGMYMTYGYGVSLINVIITGLLLYRKKLKGIIPTPFVTICLVINFIGLYYSYTRGGLLGYLAALPFFFFKDNKKSFLTIILLAVVGLGGSLVVSDKMKDMFLKRKGSNEQRISFYQAAFYAFKENPILGLGYRNFEPNSSAIKKKYNLAHPTNVGHAHNNLLEHLASTGILGFLAVLGFFLSWIYECYKRSDIIGQTAFVFGISFFISGMFQYSFGDGENVFLLMGVWVLTQITSLKEKIA